MQKPINYTRRQTGWQCVHGLRAELFNHGMATQSALGCLDAPTSMPGGAVTRVVDTNCPQPMRWVHTACVLRPEPETTSPGLHALSPKVKDILEAATRKNGRRTMAVADAKLLAGEPETTSPGLMSCRAGSQRNNRHWEQRRVNEALCITYQGWHWSVANLRGVYVGALVQCHLTRRGAFLRVQFEHEAHVGILASRRAPAHSHPHTPPAVGIAVNSGTWTTGDAPAPQSASPDGHAPRTPQKPPAAKPGAHRRSRNESTAGAAPVVGPITIELVAEPEQNQSFRHRKKGRNRPRVSLQISIRFDGSNLATRNTFA